MLHSTLDYFSRIEIRNSFSLIKTQAIKMLFGRYELGPFSSSFMRWPVCYWLTKKCSRISVDGKSIYRRIIPPSEGPLPIIVDILIESIDAISEIKMDFRKLFHLSYIKYNASVIRRIIYGNLYLDDIFTMMQFMMKMIKVWHYLFVILGLIRWVFKLNDSYNSSVNSKRWLVIK